LKAITLSIQPLTASHAGALHGNHQFTARMQMNRVKWAVLIMALLALLASCSKKEENANEEQKSNSSEASQPAAAAIDPATVATVSGTVKFDGAAPKPQKIDMSQDPACGGKQNMSEAVEVDNGNLENVFVYVKDGLGNRTFAAPKDPVEIDQEGCRYHPHVIGVMAGQTVKIVNSDNTTHNIHPTPKENREWNESQPPKAAPLEKTFAREEIELPVKCNQHPWMKMYVNVVKHPFFAVSGKDGKFEIKGLPPGDYTIVAVHEKLGQQEQKVTVAPKDAKTVDFTFKSGGSAAAGM
jgi:plastocyanin